MSSCIVLFRWRNVHHVCICCLLLLLIVRANSRSDMTQGEWLYHDQQQVIYFRFEWKENIRDCIQLRWSWAENLNQFLQILYKWEEPCSRKTYIDINSAQGATFNLRRRSKSWNICQTLNLGTSKAALAQNPFGWMNYNRTKMSVFHHESLNYYVYILCSLLEWPSTTCAQERNRNWRQYCGKCR